MPEGSLLEADHPGNGVLIARLSTAFGMAADLTGRKRLSTLWGTVASYATDDRDWDDPIAFVQRPIVRLEGQRHPVEAGAIGGEQPSRDQSQCLIQALVFDNISHCWSLHRALGGEIGRRNTGRREKPKLEDARGQGRRCETLGHAPSGAPRQAGSGVRRGFLDLVGICRLRLEVDRAGAAADVPPAGSALRDDEVERADSGEKASLCMEPRQRRRPRSSRQVASTRSTHDRRGPGDARHALPARQALPWR